MVLWFAIVACVTGHPHLAAVCMVWLIFGSTTRLDRMWLWLAFAFAAWGMPMAALWALFVAWMFESPAPVSKTRPLAPS